MTMTRFISSLLFSSAFIWVAVEFFDVETEVVYVLFIFSLILVGAAIVTGLLISPPFAENLAASRVKFIESASC